MKLPGLNFNKSMATSFIYVLCGILIRNVHSSDMELNETGITWFDASTFCKEKGLKLEHDFTHFNLEDLRGKQFWIGIIRYVEVSAWMKPLGCFNIYGNDRTPFTAGSIGLCQHHCNENQRFSYQIFSHSCICINDRDKLPTQLHIKECFVREKEYNMFVYGKFPSVESMTNDMNENCLVATCSEGKIQLGPHICNNENTVATICEDKTPPDNLTYWTYDFSTAQTKCNAINKTLIQPKNLKCISFAIKFWTSVNRENVIVEYFDVKSNDESAKDCLYGDARNLSNLHIFEIKSKPCQNQMEFFACKHNTNETRTTMHMENDSSGQTNDTNETRTTMHMENDSSGQTNDLDTSGTTSGYMKSNISSQSSGALVGGIVGGILVIAFAVLIIVFIHRKRNTKPPEKKAVYSDSNCIGSDSNGKQFLNMEYDLANNIINVTSSSKKAILSEGENKLMAEYSKVDISKQRCSSNVDIYNTASEGEYDKLNNVLSRKNNNETNLYGITGHAGEDEYDTVTGALQVKRAEDLYDTNVPVYGGKGDSTYDTANQFQHRQMDRNSTYGYSP